MHVAATSKARSAIVPSTCFYAPSSSQHYTLQMRWQRLPGKELQVQYGAEHFWNVVHICAREGVGGAVVDAAASTAARVEAPAAHAALQAAAAACLEHDAVHVVAAMLT
jgi:glycine cleavage system aminomethyltransferase T